MNKLLLLLLVPIATISCVDDSYDLSKVDTDNLVIGGEAVIEMPLAQIVFGLPDLVSDDNATMDVVDVFSEVDIWTPTTISEVDVALLVNNSNASTDYSADLLGGLVDEMETSTEKLNEVAWLVATKYRDQFSELVPSANLTDEEFVSQFMAAFERDPQGVGAALIALGQSYLSGVTFSPVKVNIDQIAISDVVIDMLADDLDHADSYLELTGTIENNIPLTMYTNPVANNPLGALILDFGHVDVDLGVTAIKPIRITGENLRAIINGSTIEIPINFKSYERGSLSASDAAYDVVILLQLNRYGGLAL